MTFSSAFDPARVRALADASLRASADDARSVLVAGVRTLADAAALLSPAASAMLEDIAAQSHRVTVERFGKNIFLFAPLYLSNECVCTCTYCGFSMGLDIRRRTLRVDEVAREAANLRERGMRSVLLVSAEHPKQVPMAYVARAVEAAKRFAPYVGVEIAAAETADYRALIDAGCDGVVLYQETYDPDAYPRYHRGGPKMRFGWRMDALERAGVAGAKHLGIGALFGLADWRYEMLALIAHARHLERRCWRSQINVSLPRINPAAGGFAPEHPIGDRDFVHALCALRIALPTAGIMLSTREPAALRDRLVPLGITHMSAGSSTEPGGYEEPGGAGEQFALEDLRTADEVARRIRALGYEPVFKDWEIMAPVAATTA